MSPLNGDLVLSEVSIRAIPNLDILGVKIDKLTFEDHVRGIVSRVSQRIGILRLVKRIFVDTSVLLRCYFAYLSPNPWSIVRRCGGQLLNVTFSFLSERCIRWPGFVPIRISCRCAIDVVWQGLVCFTRLIRTPIILFSELPSAPTRVRHIRAAAAAHPLEFELSRCRTSQFARSFLPAQVLLWNDLP